MQRLRKLMAVVLGLTPVLAAIPVRAAASTTVVTPANMANSFADVMSDNSKWFFYNDQNDSIDPSLGSFVAGPATAPAGNDSVQIQVSGEQRRNLATYRFSGTKLADLTELKFSTYNPSTGNGGSATRSGYLNFNVDFDGTDTWQRRLVFLPSDNGTVQQDTWQEWDAVNGGNALYRYSGGTWPIDGLPGSTTKTLSQIISQYSGVRMRVGDSWLGIRVGEPYADGYTENIDKFIIDTTTTDRMVFDFESKLTYPKTKDDCKNGGWATFTGVTFRNQGDCIHYVKENTHEVEGTLMLSNPNQKIKFRDEEKGWWHRSKHGPSVEYWNYEYPGGLHYKADVMCTSLGATKKEARVMFQIPDGYPGLSGLYIVSYVKEGKGKTKAMYGHAATADVNVARQWCETGQGFSPSMYPVVRGDVEVH